MIYGCVKSKLDGTEKVFSEKGKVPSNYRYTLPKVIDQGSKPICTACAISSFINWKYNCKDGNATRDNKVNLDKLFKDGGGSSNGAELKKVIQAAKKDYNIKDYFLIKNPQQLQYAIISNGPCVGGIMVQDSSITNFWDGYGNLGGHAIALVGYTKDGFIIRNSWGESYGNKGYSVLPYSDFNKLFEIWTLV